jgi:ABC-type nitrate/sulfonate/bicarbonate transport system substrate-binding protein
VLRGWGTANTDTLVKYAQAYIEGLRWMLNPANKAEAVALLAERLKLPADVAGQAFDATLKGFQPDGALDMAGVRNVLKLRAEFEGGTPADPAKYIDLSYYEKAKAGM